MKQLMLGNQALARGLYEAGCSVVSSYPGTPSTEITEEAAKFEEIYCEWAPNEKVALETAFGASLAGRRSFCGMKHVGLNVAADPLFTSAYTGVNAGLIICVADDAGMHSSQNEQDSRHYAIAAKLPMLEPSDSGEAYEFAKQAYVLSEEFDTPVIIKMCTRVAHSQSVVEAGERSLPERLPYVKDIAKYVMTPGNAIRRHPIVEERIRRLAEYANDCPFNRIEWGGRKLGIITSSTSYQYVKEVFGDAVSVLKLGMIYPLPEKLIRQLAEGVDELLVVEELDPIVENYCKSLGLSVHGKDILPLEGEFSQNLIAACVKSTLMPELVCPEYHRLEEVLPGRPPVMCAGCPHRGLFYTLSKNRCTVMGDIGCYTLGAAAPLSAIDMTLCMGASIGAQHGFYKALAIGAGEAAADGAEETAGADMPQKLVSVIGDSTFMHSGMTGLANIAYNRSNSTVIILDNSITGMTGHQQNPTTGYNIKGDPAGKIDLEALCRAMGFERVSVVDPYNLKECDRVLKEELAVAEPSVIISRRPCALLKYVKHKAPLTVDTDKCKGCKACMRLGCPAISVRNGKAVIDTTQCVGCGVCQQLCSFDALQEGGAEE